MARFDAWPDGDGWLLEVQADLLSDLNTRVVVPLMDQSDAIGNALDLLLTGVRGRRE